MVAKKKLIPFLLSSLLFLSGCIHTRTEVGISSDFPYQSRYITVNQQQMHYIEQGSGPVVLFLHGNPTSSYMWRNIIPYVAKEHRAIAVDLIGMGKSSQPNLSYDYKTHYAYLEGFIKQMKLKNITLVLHDWGSGLGFHYFDEHPENVQAIAFMEAMTRPFKWSDLSLPEELLFRAFRDPKQGKKLLIEENRFVNTLLPLFTQRELSPKELEAYKAPFIIPEKRKPIYVWPNEVPIDGFPVHTHQILASYRKRLAQSTIPKLLFWVKPGALIKGEPEVKRIQSEMSNLETVFLGEGRHYVAESYPNKIGSTLANWLKRKLKRG